MSNLGRIIETGVSEPNANMVILGPDGKPISIIRNGNVISSLWPYLRGSETDIGIKDPSKAKKLTVNGEKYDINNSGLIHTLEPHQSRQIIRKALSTGLMGAMLWLYTASNRLFGNTKNNEREQYKQGEVYNPADGISPAVTTTPMPQNRDLSDVVSKVLTDFSGIYEKYKDGAYLDMNRWELVPKAEYEKRKSESKAEDPKGEPKQEKSWFSNNWYWVVPTAAVVIGGGIYLATKKKSEPEEEKTQIRAKIEDVINSLTRNSVPGANVSFVYNGQTIPATIGQYTNIAQVKKGTSITVQMIAEADNYIRRKILSEVMDGDENYTLNIAPASETLRIDNNDYIFNWDTFVNQIVRDNVINRLKPPTSGKLTMYFNPDYSGTGKRLPQDIINELKNKVWEWIKNNSNGEITQIEYIENGTHGPGHQSTEGEINVYEDTAGGTASSGVDKNPDGSIKAIDIYFNSTKVGTGYNVLWSESFDSIFDREINMTKDAWKPLVIFGFKRIAGNNNGYKARLVEGEEQNTTDKYSGASAQSANMLNALSRFDSAMQNANMPSIMRQRIRVGKRANLEAGLDPSGRVNLGGSYDIGDGNGAGNVMFMTDLQGKGLVIGGNKRFGNQYVGLVYDKSLNRARFNGDFTLPLGIRLSGSIDDKIPLSASFNRNGLGIAGAVDNVLNMNYAAGQFNLDAGDFDFAARYIYNKLGSDLAGFGVTYNFGDLQVNVDATKDNNSHALNIGLLAKALKIAGAQGNFSLMGGIDSNGNKRIYISFAATGF